MVGRSKYLKEVFPSPPLTAFRRQPNLRSHIIRASLPNPNNRPTQRKLVGMKKCNTPKCTACPFIKEGKEITINGQTWKINSKLDCKSYNIVNAILCKKENCRSVYIGETKRMLKFRLADHRGYVSNKETTQATGSHFNLPGHTLAHLQVTCIERVKKNNTL